MEAKNAQSNSHGHDRSTKTDRIKQYAKQTNNSISRRNKKQAIKERIHRRDQPPRLTLLFRVRTRRGCIIKVMRGTGGVETRKRETRKSKGDADLDPSTIATHVELLGHKPTQPAHPSPTPVSVGLKREKGHVPSTRVTCRLPTVLRLSSV